MAISVTVTESPVYVTVDETNNNVTLNQSDNCTLMPRFLPGNGTSSFTKDEWFLATSSSKFLANSDTVAVCFLPKVKLLTALKFSMLKPLVTVSLVPRSL